MKKLWGIILAGLMLIGCQDNLPADNSIVGVGETALTISLPSTRTSLGEKEGATYPVYWSEGDCIAVNGVKSQAAQIDTENPAKARFEMESVVEYPYSITYPYCEATSAEQAKVVFPNKQSYVEGSFAQGCAPMYGYAKDGNGVALNHLATVLRLPIRASEVGVVLSKVVVSSISGAKIAGEFAVDCATGAVTPCDGAKTSITYSLPKNFTLSTDEDRVLYIALPAVEVGLCGIEFVTSSGENMRANWSADNLVAGVVREFKSITFKAGVDYTLESMKADSGDTIITSHLVDGYVRDNLCRAIEGVAVSDGFTIVTTDKNGYYSMGVSSDTWYIYITIPAEYKIGANEYGLPDFYQKYNAKKSRYNFTLTPLEGGKEEKFALFVLGDPQVATQAGLNRLNDEAIPAIKSHASEIATQGIPCYGITLGDLISNNNSNDRSEWRDDVRESFSLEKVGIPVFHVIGNHDNTFFNASNPISADERNSTFELTAQRAHEDMFGPVNFSFDRGDMHIISMRNTMYYLDNDCESKIRRSYLPEQYRWLKQDLALVPKDKTVIYCVHLPMLDGGGSYVDMTRELINQYKEAHIMSGHSHLIQAIEAIKQPNIFEHNMGALCGAWWTSYMCGDGSPCGYGVFMADGTTFSDWYHIGYDKTSRNRSHQMRLYRGNAVTGAAVSGTDTSKTKGYYQFNFDEDILLANVYMADDKWSIKVYEDGVYSGDMVNISVKNGQLADVEHFRRPKIYRNESSTPTTDGVGYMYGDGSFANPYKSSVVTAGDIYFSGYTNGVRGYGDWSIGTNAQCYHMYMYKLKNKDAAIKVEATDRFGNVYTETKITEGTDYSTVKY